MSGQFQVVAYGENVDDLGDIRPGSRAAEEFQVKSPLREAGMTKEDIREASRHLGLPTAEKPQMACLSSRIPHGDPVTRQKLEMIEKAEALLMNMGISGSRVRCHELKHGFLARIEVHQNDWNAITHQGSAGKIDHAMRQLGFYFSTLDLAGYKKGGRSALESAAATESVTK